MLTLSRGLAAALLVLGLAGTALVSAQAPKKEEEKKTVDPKAKAKEEARDRSVSFETSDGLALQGFFYQGTGVDKQNPDAVLMFPAPGNKVNDAWQSLARALSEKNFSVLLFDWRGVGANSIDAAGPRVIADNTVFWKEVYNGRMLMKSKKTIEDKGLDWKQLGSTTMNGARYRDFMVNDLLAARFYMDKQNDGGRCNTNRVWVVSEKDGAHAGIGFIAAEFQRNSVYKEKVNLFDRDEQFRPAGKDYAGFVALSFSSSGTMSPTGDMLFSASLPRNGNDNVKAAMDHLKDRLAMVMVDPKGKNSAARTMVARTGVPLGKPEDMKEKFKYLHEVEMKVTKPIVGIDMIDPADSFGVKAYLVKAMVEISKDKQNLGKTFTNRDAAKIVNPPRFEIEKFMGR